MREKEEVLVLMPEGQESVLEETVFGEDVDTQTYVKRPGPLERNLSSINFMLIVLGILCITFMVLILLFQNHLLLPLLFSTFVPEIPPIITNRSKFCS